MKDLEKDIVQLVRLALSGKESDLKAYAKKVLAPILRERQDLASMGREVIGLLDVKNPSRGAQGTAIQPLPVDLDSRQELIRREQNPELPNHIVWPESVHKVLKEVIEEHEQYYKLLEADLSPSRTILFFGPPGVGKTLAARWLSKKLQRPLLTLDLAAVMSSYLGKTGNNIRTVLEFAKKSPSVLLLDEFDAIAKRRDDNVEVGELKRLVTVLLQAIDDWPSTGILISATNHPELLDPAVWRRFDRIIEFPRPSESYRLQYIEMLMKTQIVEVKNETVQMLSVIMCEQSFAEIKRDLDGLRRQILISKRSQREVVEEFLVTQIGHCKTPTKIKLAEQLISLGYSQHKIHEITGLSRDTLRNHFPNQWKSNRSLPSNEGTLDGART